MKTGFAVVAGAFFVLVSCVGAQSIQDGRAVSGKDYNEVFLRNDQLGGWLLDNEGNAGRDGGGFNMLYHASYPDKSLYYGRHVGLNFEHIFNGSASDRDISMFTPRRESNYLLKQGTAQGTLRWPSGMSSWGVSCTMTYTFVEPDAIDMQFTAVPLVEKWPHGYLAFMWASYMNRTRERTIHFWGTNGGDAEWLAFGEDTDDERGFEVGTVAATGVAPLLYDEESQSLNIVEHPTKRFVYPFYYGLIDGDQDLATEDDTLVYILMFDQLEPIRFALWNFIRGADGKPDAHSPAWDWQYVIRDPKVGARYGYRMRVVVAPFAGREDVLERYRDWAGR